MKPAGTKSNGDGSVKDLDAHKSRVEQEFRELFRGDGKPPEADLWRQVLQMAHEHPAGFLLVRKLILDLAQGHTEETLDGMKPGSGEQVLERLWFGAGARGALMDAYRKLHPNWIRNKILALETPVRVDNTPDEE